MPPQPIKATRGLSPAALVGGSAAHDSSTNQFGNVVEATIAAAVFKNKRLVIFLVLATENGAMFSSQFPRVTGIFHLIAQQLATMNVFFTHGTENVAMFNNLSPRVAGTSCDSTLESKHRNDLMFDNLTDREYFCACYV